MKLLRQLGFIRAHTETDRCTDMQADREIVRVCVGASDRGTADRQMEFWVHAVATQISHSHPVPLIPPAPFIALLQVYLGNSKARPLLKP